jgi:di/tripeptidase
MERFGDRVTEFVTFDSHPKFVANGAVGSHRYSIEVKTAGGHSFGNFGRTNSIAVMAQLINKLYSVSLPETGRTTYNVGTISGGTSVNTIAQSAKMLCEYRSDNEECLAIMKGHFERIFEKAADGNVKISITQVGDRPCMGKVDRDEIARLADLCSEIITDITKKPVGRHSSSTDCNIPLSLGIPAICVGVYRGGGTHTREEWIEKASLRIGLEVGIKTIERMVK